MRYLVRPTQGRIVGGVALAFAERYALDEALVRFVFFSSLLAAPIAVLIYLLLWTAIPSERAVAMSLSTPRGERPDEPKFEAASGVLLWRLGVTHSVRRAVPAPLVAFTMLGSAIILQLPALEGADFYSVHPMLASILSFIGQINVALFYFSLALFFLLFPRGLRSSAGLWLPEVRQFTLDAGETRAIYGLASGIAHATGIDTAYWRVVFVLLNILTFGIFGVLYFIVSYLLRKSAQKIRSEPGIPATTHSSLFRAAQIVIGIAFLFLTAIRLATEFRWFFFNEPFFQGIVTCTVGAIFSLRALRTHSGSNRGRLWLMLGAILLFAGIEDIVTAIFGVQLPFAAKFQSTYFLIALVLIYLSLVAEHPTGRKITMSFALLFLASIGFLQFGLIPIHFLTLIIQFYGFFYPVIFAGFGLWLVMERR